MNLHGRLGECNSYQCAFCNSSSLRMLVEREIHPMFLYIVSSADHFARIRGSHLVTCVDQISNQTTCLEIVSNQTPLSDRRLAGGMRKSNPSWSVTALLLTWKCSEDKKSEGASEWFHRYQIWNNSELCSTVCRLVLRYVIHTTKYTRTTSPEPSTIYMHFWYQ